MRFIAWDHILLKALHECVCAVCVFLYSTTFQKLNLFVFTDGFPTAVLWIVQGKKRTREQKNRRRESERTNKKAFHIQWKTWKWNPRRNRIATRNVKHEHMCYCLFFSSFYLLDFVLASIWSHNDFDTDRVKKSATFTYTHGMHLTYVIDETWQLIVKKSTTEGKSTDKEDTFDENVAKRSHHRRRRCHCRYRNSSSSSGNNNKWIWIEMWIYKRHHQ